MVILNPCFAWLIGTGHLAGNPFSARASRYLSHQVSGDAGYQVASARGERGNGAMACSDSRHSAANIDTRSS